MEVPRLEGLSYYLETYGCQMNVSDSQIVSSVLEAAGMAPSNDVSQADVVLLNTCAIRDNAEGKVWTRLAQLKGLKETHPGLTVGVLGCMAERLKHRLLEKEKLVEVIAGPDAYRSLPQLLAAVRLEGSPYAIDVQLSPEETYADVVPVRRSGVSAFVSVMRGCNNMCSFCIVPFTRGRERSRPLESIVAEVKLLAETGVKEVTLLGQNVNSYCDLTSQGTSGHFNSPGFQELYKARPVQGAKFADLLRAVAEVAPSVRFRFTSPHPKDFPEALLSVVEAYPNVCKSIHLPLQSGSNSVLTRMRRLYTREAYLDLVETIRGRLPGVSISTDVITGFCDETEADHELTLDVMQRVKYEQAFMFAYSMRPRTHAANHWQDNVPSETKSRRLGEVIEVFRSNLALINQAEVGSRHWVLIDGPSKRNPAQLAGRTDSNKRVILKESAQVSVGDVVEVVVEEAGPQTLYGTVVEKKGF
jgi:tRNA-N(6)-(isopentenyl)adenosine-37 thiotransferase enzyme MiaB